MRFTGRRADGRFAASGAALARLCSTPYSCIVLVRRVPFVNRASRINFAALALIALAGGGLGGCGRAGPLEPPPDAQAVARQQAQEKTASATTDAAQGVPRARPKPKPIEAPKQSFFLDPLL